MIYVAIAVGGLLIGAVAGVIIVDRLAFLTFRPPW